MISLTIEPTQCILDGISLYESIDITILDKLINSKLLKTTFNNKICANIFANEKEQLIKYRALFKKINHAVIKYKRSRGNPYGRSNPVGGLGLHNLRREIRQTLTKGRFKDIDIKNCHPVMLLQIIQHANLPTVHLKSYVENRQEWFNLITGAYKCTEEQAKTLMIVYTYGGGFKKWIDKEKLDASFEELPELTAFKNEVRHYHGVITRHNPHLKKAAKKIKDESGLIDITNVEGTVCAYFLQDYEVRVLETLYNYCIENDIIKNRVAVLCADGIMIEAENYNESLLTIFNKIVKEKIGFDLTFVEKPMKQDYLDILDVNVIPESLPEPIVVDTPAVDKLIQEFGEYELHFDNDGCEESGTAKIFNKVCFNNNVIFTGKNKEPTGYIYNGVYWKELSLSNAELMRGNFDTLTNYFKNKASILKKIVKLFEGNEQKQREYEMMYNKYVAKVGDIGKYNIRKNIIKIFQADNYVDEVEWNKNPDLFCFNDCIYDLSKGAFQETHDPKDYINLTCGRKYKNDFDKETVEKAEVEIETFIKSIVLQEDYLYVMKLLSSFLRQENKDERGHFWLGLGRNGKGTICELLRENLGNYWGELSMDYYICHSKDKDRPNQNLYNCRNARILNSSEIGDDNGTGGSVKFITDAFKTITGGDPIYARELGTKNTVNFKAGKILIQTNVLPAFSKQLNTSLKERIVVINFPYIFTDNTELLESDPNKYKKKDNTLKDKYKGNIYKVALTNILFKYYKEYKKDFTIPPSIKAYTQTYFNSVDIVNLIMSNCEFSDINDKIHFNELKKMIKEEFNKDYSNKQIKTELEDGGLIIVKIRGFYYLKGYKLIDEDTGEISGGLEDFILEEV